MATLKRVHPPTWGAQVEQMVWQRSRSGKPRRTRSDRPPLTYDPEWDWDGTRVSFSETLVIHDREEGDYGTQDWQVRVRDDAPSYQHGVLSLLDVARHVSKRHGKARSYVDDFEVVRVPKVVPVVDEELDLGDRWELHEWEKLDDMLGLKRTYLEVARGSVDEKGHPNSLSSPQFPLGSDEDDVWECL